MGTLRAQSRELTISLIIFIFAHKQPQLFVDIMPATPPYEEDVPRGYSTGFNGKMLRERNHQVLYAIRKTVGILERDGLMRRFIQQSLSNSEKALLGMPVNSEEGSSFTKEELSSISSQYSDLVDAWVDLERAFGDLEENRRHPGLWDKLLIVFRWKNPDRTIHGLVGENFNRNLESVDSSSDSG